MTLVVPMLLGGAVALSTRLAMGARDKPVRLALVDRSEPAIGDTLRASLETPHAEKATFVVETSGGTAEIPALQSRVDSGDLDGYLLVPPDVARGDHALYRGTNAASLTTVARLTTALRNAVIAGRAKAMGIDGARAGELLADVSLDAEQASGAGSKASGNTTFLAAYFASFVLYLGIVIYGLTVARAVMQEKTSRTIEMLVACVRPGDLMVGKIIGVGALGLTQMTVWLMATVGIAAFRGPLLSRVGVQGAESVALPHFGGAEVGVVLAYFLGGYFLYASLFAALGAASSSDRDAQQGQLAVLIPMIAAFMCGPVITADPRGTAATALTLFPLFSPILMPTRYMLTPIALWELASSLGVLAVTMVLTTWLGARIYRVGILMVGKRPGVMEIIRWIRAS
jgi:ABC-2 type transport system permease protein